MQARLPQLDGIRGIAILMVILHNESVKYPMLSLDRLFTNGWMGVDLFFVLSGFLITGILLDSKQSEDYFRNFYIRRCLRIWPLYYASLFFMFVVVPFVRPDESATVFAERSSPWWSYPFYLQNFLVPIPDKATGLLGVTWSLAIEEQFYLAWPLVIRFASMAALRRIALIVICLSPALRLWMVAQGMQIYSNTFSRLDGLMAGALLAAVIRSRDFEPSRSLGKAWGAFLVLGPLAFAITSVEARWIVFSMSALASVALVYVALYSRQRWLQAFLTNRFLVYTGAISYGLYLLHKIPFNLGRLLNLDDYPAVAGPLLLAVSYGVATLSWFILEKPYLKLKRFFPTRAERTLHLNEAKQ
jgi:peptidoglycan/LPS O-acetylase OafA/YrhL